MPLQVYNGQFITDDLAKQCYEEGQYEQAISYYEVLIDYCLPRASLYISQGNCFYKLGRYDDALKSFQQAVSIVNDTDIEYLEAWLGQCLVYVEMKRYSEAWHTYWLLIDKYPNASSIYNVKGQLLRSQGNLISALDSFNEALHLATKNENIADYYYNKSLTLRDLERYNEAIDALDEAILRSPLKPLYREAIRNIPLVYLRKKSAYYSEKGEQDLAGKRYEAALSLFDHSLLFFPSFVPAHFGKGKTLLALKRVKEALESFNQALKLHPKHTFVLIAKGDVLLTLQRYDEAIQAYDRAIQLNSKIDQAYVGRGHALFALQHYKEAMQDYEIATEINIYNSEIYHNLVVCLYTLSLFEKAHKYNDKWLQFSPNNPDAYVCLGNIEYLQQHYEQAFVAYEQAIHLGKISTQVYLWMGDCTIARGEQGVAKSYYQKALLLAQQKSNFEIFRAIVDKYYSPLRPSSVQFELFYMLLAGPTSTENISEIIQKIALYYEQLSQPNALLFTPLEEYTNKLKTLIECFPQAQNEDFLFAATAKEPLRLARLFIAFAPDIPVGLSMCILHLLQKWIFTEESNEIALQLYSTLPTCDVQKDEQDLFYARLLFSQSRYAEAEPILARLIQDPLTSSDILWLYVETLNHCNRPLWLQIDILHRLKSLVPSEPRLADAWVTVGDYCSKYEGRWADAMLAYENAKELGITSPILKAYWQGAWNAIPALYTSPDYHFPVVVSLDLECDYNQQAAPGSTIFEVGTVRGKGMTELDRYHAIVRREPMPGKVAHLIGEAKDIAVVIQELRKFIGTDIVVGHNIRAFDSVQLRGVGLDLPDEQMLDTLEFARLLYPDSIHHNLGFLCEQLGCQFDEQHNALPDARACANLLHKLGDELVRRGDTLISGFRAFITPDSAFDRAILQLRNVAANPAINWKLDPTPSPVHQLTSVYAAQAPASPSMVEALKEQQDALIERYDPRAAYIEHIPVERKTLVLAGNRQRLERMLLAAKSRDDVYVLPHPQTLLCPQRVTQRIEQQQENSMKLLLFCLYQASHNHDVQTLYPLRLPADELRELREMLLADCCGRDTEHTHSCKVHSEARRTIDTVQLLIATHDNFIQYQKSPEQYVQGNNRELLIVDNLDELQMRFVDYVGEYVDSDASRLQELTIGEHEALQRFTEEIVTFAHRYIDVPKYHERILLSVFQQWLQDNPQLQDALSHLESSGPVGKTMVQQIRTFIDESTQRVQ